MDVQSFNLNQKIRHLLSKDKAIPSTADQETDSKFYQETRQERYLTCCSCIVLYLNDDSTTSESVRAVLEEHGDLKSFIEELLKAPLKLKVDDESSCVSGRLNTLYCLLGMRILHSYYLGMSKTEAGKEVLSECINEGWINHFNLVNRLMKHFFIIAKDSNDKRLHVEILEFYGLLVQILMIWWADQSDNHENDQRKNVAQSMIQSGCLQDTKQQSAWIFDDYFTYFNHSDATQFDDKDSSNNQEVSNGDKMNDPKHIMLHILSSILSQSEESSIVQKNQFEVAVVNFFDYHQQLTHITNMSLFSSMNKTSQSKTLEKSTLMNMLRFITTPVASLPSEMKEKALETKLLLHTALLSLVHTEVISSNDNANGIIQLMSSNASVKSKALKPDHEVTALMQRVFVMNLSAILDHFTAHSIEKSDDEKKQTVITVNGIRTLTLDILSTLLDKCGIDWILCNNESGSTHGQSSMFCTIMRLVVGELRLVMGHLVDQIYTNEEKRLESSNTIEVVNDEDTNEIFKQYHLTRIEHCIDIGLFGLKVMLDFADDDKNDPLKFTPDAILHVKHSFDDMLDSVVQFLLHMDLSTEMNVDNSDECWDYGTLLCSRFLGAYLDDVDIFDYDTNSTDNQESRGQSGYDMKGDVQEVDAKRAPVTSQTLFAAVRNTLLLHFKLIKTTGQTEIKGVGVVTLFPCICNILCNSIDDELNEEMRQRRIKLTRKYLLKEPGLESIICTVLDQSLKCTKCAVNIAEAEVYLQTETLCNFVVKSLFQFMMNSSKQQLDSKDEAVIQALFNSMSQWLRYIVHDAPNDFHLKEKSNQITGTMLSTVMSIRKHARRGFWDRLNSETRSLMNEIGLM